MTDISIKHEDLNDLIQSVINDRADVQLFDSKQAYFQLKSAYDYIQSELNSEDAFAACPVVLRGAIEAFLPVDDGQLTATLVVDVVMHLTLDNEYGLLAFPLHENEDEPTVNVNVVDVVFDAPEGFDYVTDPFDLTLPNSVVHGQCDLPTDYILFNLKDLTNKFSYSLDFSTIFTAIENMSVAIVNSK